MLAKLQFQSVNKNVMQTFIRVIILVIVKVNARTVVMGCVLIRLNNHALIVVPIIQQCAITHLDALFVLLWVNVSILRISAILVKWKIVLNVEMLITLKIAYYAILLASVIQIMMVLFVLLAKI